MLATAASCRAYIHTHPPSVLAAHLRADQALIAQHKPPSLLALHLPARLADAIAACLWDEGADGPRPPPQILRLRYHGVVDGIKSYLAAPGAAAPAQGILESAMPADGDFEAALRVLEYLARVPATRVGPETPLRDVVVAVQTQGAVGAGMRAAYAAGGWETGGKKRQRARAKCYMCHYANTTPHRVYRSLCSSCGSFNLAESRISTPGVLDMRGRTALVTGGRVNLGYEVAVRLLRCGAGVVVSSRYPLDAERRLRAEADFGGWRERVWVVGADFRHMRDAGALVGEVKRILGLWGERSGRGPVLDVLVNNAAQTLTDSRAKEGAAVERETALRLGHGALGELQGADYRAKIRGGARENRILVGGPGGEAESYHDEATGTSASPAGTSLQREEKTPRQEVAAVQPQSSWTQRISEIPYQDIGDVLAINSFVPLMLIRELLPLMGCGPAERSSLKKPAGYIINVSSREGLSEASPDASIKGGHHVHTNMSKAALNMITETEAHPAWRDRRIAMNSVDPGFMSAADGGECPIGWADGAARVLWCVAKGEVEGECVWGRFLKHFGGAEAVVRGL